jgi:hypothetical protein
MWLLSPYLIAQFEDETGLHPHQVKWLGSKGDLYYCRHQWVAELRKKGRGEPRWIHQLGTCG